MSKTAIEKAAQSFLDYIRSNTENLTERDRRVFMRGITEMIEHIRKSPTDEEAWDIYNRMVQDVLDLSGKYRREVNNFAAGVINDAQEVLQCNGTPTTLDTLALQMMAGAVQMTNPPGDEVTPGYLRDIKPILDTVDREEIQSVRQVLHNNYRMKWWLMHQATNDELERAIRLVLTMRNQDGKFTEGDDLLTQVTVILDWKEDPTGNKAFYQMVSKHGGKAQSAQKNESTFDPSDGDVDGLVFEDDEDGPSYTQEIWFQDRIKAKRFLDELQDQHNREPDLWPVFPQYECYLVTFSLTKDDEDLSGTI